MGITIEDVLKTLRDLEGDVAYYFRCKVQDWPAPITLSLDEIRQELEALKK